MTQTQTSPTSAPATAGLHTLTLHLRQPAVRLFGPSVEQYLVRGFVKTLDSIGVATTVVHDDRWSGVDLHGVDVVFVPYAPRLSAETAAGLRRYVEGGGLLVVGMDPPAELRDLFVERGTQRVLTPPDADARQPVMPTRVQRAEIGAPQGFPPRVRVLTRDYWLVQPKAGVEVWARWEDGSPATLATDRALWMTTANHEPDRYRYGQHIQFTRDREQLGTMLLAFLNRAANARQRAAVLHGLHDELAHWAPSNTVADGDVMATYRALLHAHRAYEEAAESADVEMRQVNIANPFAVTDWSATLDALADANINFLIISLTSAPYLQYCDENNERPEYTLDNVLPEIIAGCNARHIEFWPWVMTWSCIGPTMSRRMEAERRTARGDSEYEPDVPAWLCPSHPENLALDVRFVESYAKKLKGIGGFLFDFFRFPREDYCICAGCHQRFAEWLGESVPQWPIPPGQADLLAKWRRWRCEIITNVSRTLREAIHGADPSMYLGAAVFPAWHLSWRQVGQDIRAMVRQRAIDVLFPMDYAHTTALLEGEVRYQEQVCRGYDTYLCPLLGPYSFTADNTGPEMVAQITALKKIGVDGWGVFAQNHAITLESFLPVLKRGLTRRPAKLPWRVGSRPGKKLSPVTGAIAEPQRIIDWPFGTSDLSIYKDTQTP